ncbi:MAG: PaaI family thioesterase [bacterium]|nr:PaaI family thioesterase [bacterium]
MDEIKNIPWKQQGCLKRVRKGADRSAIGRRSPEKINGTERTSYIKGREVMKVIGKQRNSRMCFICGMDNPIGLRAQFYNMEDGSVMTPFVFRREHQSFPERVHGGLAATMIDELGLRAMWAKDQSEESFGVTMSLSVKYRKPVPYDEELFARGIVVKESPKFVTIDAGIYDREGRLLVNGEAVYIKLNPEQIVSEAVDTHEEMCYLLEDEVRELPFH